MSSFTAVWADPKIAAAYKSAELITGHFAELLLRQAGLPPGPSGSASAATEEGPAALVVLDNACGTGIVSKRLWEILDEQGRVGLRLVCGDFSPSMVEWTRGRSGEEGWGARVEVVDAMKTGLPDEEFSHVVTNFGIMLIPDPDLVLNECFRMLKPGGIAAFSTWNSVGWYPDIRAAFATLPGSPPVPDAETLISSWGKGAWHKAEFVKGQLTAHGFVDVKVRIERYTWREKSPASFCETFRTMAKCITSAFWNEAERKKCEGLVEGALLKYLVEKYGKDSEIEMNWAAILATGRKPGG